MWTLFIKLSTMIVEQIFVRIPGVAYAPPAGSVMVDVIKTTYVGRGFTAVQDASGAWTFSPPVVVETPPEDPYAGLSVAERVAMLRVEKATADADFSAKLEALEAAIV